MHLYQIAVTKAHSVDLNNSQLLPLEFTQLTIGVFGGSCNYLDADFGFWMLDFASLHCTAWIQPRLHAMTWW
jgi:hypothetical protein